MFKVLVIQAANTLLDERAEFLINDRLSFMRFLGLGLADRAPDARTIWLFRQKLTAAGAIKPLALDGQVQQGQIDRSFGLIRRWDASDAAAYEGTRPWSGRARTSIRTPSTTSNSKRTSPPSPNASQENPLPRSRDLPGQRPTPEGYRSPASQFGTLPIVRAPWAANDEASTKPLQ